MADYCYGEITVTGDSDVLSAMNDLLSRLHTCAGVSGFDGGSDWLGHIFDNGPTIVDGIFYDGHTLGKDKLTASIRAKNTDGCACFLAMACGLGVTIRWVYGDDDRDVTFKPSGPATWRLRTLPDSEHASNEFTEWLDGWYFTCFNNMVTSCYMRVPEDKVRAFLHNLPYKSKDALMLKMPALVQQYIDEVSRNG